MRLPPIATEPLFGASVWAYRDGSVEVVPIEAWKPPREVRGDE